MSHEDTKPARCVARKIFYSFSTLGDVSGGMRSLSLEACWLLVRIVVPPRFLIKSGQEQKDKERHGKNRSNQEQRLAARI